MDIQNGTLEDQSATEEATPCPKMEQKISELREELMESRKKLKKLTTAKAKQDLAISKLFGPDQIQTLSRGRMGGVEWSPATVKKALQVRFACGTPGYKLLHQ